MKLLENRYVDIFDRCFEFTQHFMKFSKGRPALYEEGCPSVLFPTMESASESSLLPYRIVLNQAWLDQRLQEGRVNEIEFRIFRELRFLYKTSAADRMNTDADFGTDTEEMFSPEQDADAYALCLLRLMHFGGSPDVYSWLPRSVIQNSILYENLHPELKAEFDNILYNETLSFKQPGKTGNSKTVVKARKIMPNDPCPCGSGLKYKKCKCPQYHEQYR